MLSRRTFLKSAALWVPSAYAAPGIGFFGAASTPPNGLLNNLAAYWKLDDTTTGNGYVWIDATGNGFGATQVSNFVSSASGLINGCAQNNLSANAAMTVSVSLDTRLSSTPFTFAFWFLSLAVTGIGSALVEQYYSLNANTNSQTSKPQWITVDDSSNATTIVGAIGLTGGGAFDQIVCGYDGTNSFLVVNNGTRVTGAPANVRRSSETRLMNNFSNSSAWLGKLDEMGYWKRAFSATDITNHFNSGAGLPFGSYTT